MSNTRFVAHIYIVTLFAARDEKFYIAGEKNGSTSNLCSNKDHVARPAFSSDSDQRRACKLPCKMTLWHFASLVKEDTRSIYARARP